MRAIPRAQPSTTPLIRLLLNLPKRVRLASTISESSQKCPWIRDRLRPRKARCDWGRSGSRCRGRLSDKRTTDKQLVSVPQTAAPFTKAQARTFTDSLRADVQALWAKVQEAHEREAWVALGYDSFAAYMREEFDYGKAQAYRVLAAGEVVRALTPPPPPSESPKGDWRVKAREWEHQQDMEAISNVFPSVATVAPPTRLAQARELMPLRYQPEMLIAAWTQVVEEHGLQATGRQVREVVRARRDEQKSPEEQLPERLQALDRGLRFMLNANDDVLYALDNREWHAENGLLADAPPEFLDRWRESAREMQSAMGKVLRRLRAVSPCDVTPTSWRRSRSRTVVASPLRFSLTREGRLAAGSSPVLPL